MSDKNCTARDCTFSDSDLALLAAISDKHMRSGAWSSALRRRSEDCDAFLVTTNGRDLPVLSIEKRTGGRYRVVDASNTQILGGRTLSEVVEPWW